MVANFLSGKIASIKPEDMLAYVERRLAEWAHWYSRGHLFGLGYPPCSIEYRLMREGIVRTSPAGQRHLPVHENAEEIEKLVQKMAQQNSTMALALRSHYFTQRSLRTQAKEMGVSHMQLKSLVDMAKQWVVGRLSEKLFD
jgi:hypothetical protein